MLVATITSGFFCNSFADEKTTSVQVLANAQSGCLFQVGDVNFGVYDNLKESIVDHPINIKCTKGTSYILTSEVSERVNNTASIFPLQHNGYYGSMVHADDPDSKIFYQMLFYWKAPDYWNEDMNTETEQFTGVGNGENFVLNLKFKLEAGQNQKAGTYTGAQYMTLTF